MNDFNRVISDIENGDMRSAGLTAVFAWLHANCMFRCRRELEDGTFSIIDGPVQHKIARLAVAVTERPDLHEAFQGEWGRLDARTQYGIVGLTEVIFRHRSEQEKDHILSVLRELGVVKPPESAFHVVVRYKDFALV